jgi:hypothetical protein
MEELVGTISGQLENILEQLQKANQRLDDQEERFTKLEAMLNANMLENTVLKEQLLNKDNDIKLLKSKINDVEMHQRSYNIRVFNMELDGNTNNTRNVKQQVYDKLLRPVLDGAVTKGRLDSVPPADQLLETAHILPGKEGKTKPIICRFYDRFYRTTFLQLRREFAPKSTSTTTNRNAAYLYPTYEDMSSDMFKKMREINNNAAVKSCWAAGGILRFKLEDSDNIYRVHCIYDPVEKIVNRN